jgi:hypothetical protein
MTATLTAPQHRSIDDVIEAALNDYSAAIAEHRHDFAASTYESNPYARTSVCTCGYTVTGKRFPNRSVGLHVAAAQKRASKVYAAACAAALEAENVRYQAEMKAWRAAVEESVRAEQAAAFAARNA